MLKIEEVQSKNMVDVVGVLREIDIKEGTSPKCGEYASCRGTVKVDQEINGTMVESDIPFEMFSKKLTKAGNPNKVYEGILRMKESLTSLAACPENQPELASRIYIKAGELRENLYLGKDGTPRSTTKISTNFINTAYAGIEDTARFEISGVIINMLREVDSNDEETGRLKVKFGLVGYGGKVDVIELIAATPEAVNYIENNFENGDTANMWGIINYSTFTKTYYEETGFGEPIKRTKSESRRELIITNCSNGCLDESYCYNPDEIKMALADRQARAEALKTQVKPASKVTTGAANPFGF